MSKKHQAEKRPRVADKVFANCSLWAIAHLQVKKRTATLSRVPKGMQRGIRVVVDWDGLTWNEEAKAWSYEGK